MDGISKKPVFRPAPPKEQTAPSAMPQIQLSTSRIRKPLHSASMPKKRSRHTLWKKVFISISCVILFWCGYFSWKLYHISRAIQTTSAQASVNEPSTLANISSIAAALISNKHTPLKGEDSGRINILLLGKAGEHHSGRDLTDTVMIMSIDTRTKKIALLSLPRDLYVQIPDTHTFTKLNAIYQHGLAQDKGLETIEATIENITKLPISYSFVIDFDGFEKVINALGGVNVEVLRDIYDPRYPGPNFSYETFEIKKGWQVLDGATALKYVRERHNDPDGDFGRAKRQQQVIQAVKSKAFSLKTFVDAFALNDLLTILGDNIKTSITSDEIGSFIALSKQVDTNNITNVVVDAWKPESLLKVSHVMVGPTRMFTLVPRVGNYSEIQDVAANLFDINALKRRAESIATEEASITLINQSSNPQLATRVRKILQDSLGFSQVHIGSTKEIASLNTSTETSQDASFIIDTTFRQKPFSLDELLKKLPITLKQDDTITTPDNTPASDFVMILGDKLNNDLNFEEDSIDDFNKAEDDPIAYPKEMIP